MADIDAKSSQNSIVIGSGVTAAFASTIDHAKDCLITK